MHFRKQQFWSSKSDGKLYFVGRDIANCLGYKRPNDAITQHCRDTVKHRIDDITGRSHEMLIISEGDVYRLIMQ